MNEVSPTTRVGAYGLIVENDKLLLCRISPEVPHLQGLWTLPGGGLEFGEAPEAAIIREVEEETGFIVKPGALAGVDALYDPDSQPPFHGIRLIYHADKLSGALRHELSGTTDQAAWFTRRELDDLPLLSLASKGISLCFR